MIYQAFGMVPWWGWLVGMVAAAFLVTSWAVGRDERAAAETWAQMPGATR